MATYGRQPLVLVKGEGCRVWDDSGREYLDFVAGLAVCNLGHAHPEVARAASVCPWGIAWIPARTVSAMNAAV